MKTKSKSKRKTPARKPQRSAKPARKAPALKLASGPAPLKPLEVGVLVDPKLIDIDPKALREADPRRYGKESIESMSYSIQQGQITTVALERLAKPTSKDKIFRVVAGNRRVLGCIEAGAQVRADIYASDPRLANATIVENIERCDWNVMDEAEHVAERVQTEMKRGAKIGSPPLPEATACKVVANSLGRKEGWVKERVLLATRLSGAARKMVVDGRLPLASAKIIAPLADGTIRDQIAERVSQRVGDGGVLIPAWPVEKVRTLVHQYLNNLATVNWKLDVPFAGKIDCKSCPSNSANNTGLFDGGEKSIEGKAGGFDITAAGVCLNPGCFKAKADAANTAEKAAVREVVAKAEGESRKERPKAALDAARVAIDVADRGRLSPGARPPVHALKPESLASAAMAKLDRSTVKPTAAENAKDTAERAKEAAERAKRELMEQAESRLFNRRVERTQPIKDAFAGIASSKPHMAVALILAGHTQVIHECHGGNDVSRKKAGESKAMETLLAAIAAGDWDGIVQVLRLINLKAFGALSDTHMLVHAGVEDRWSKAMGVDLGPAPTLDQMLAELKSQDAGAGAPPRTRSDEIGEAYQAE